MLAWLGWMAAAIDTPRTATPSPGHLATFAPPGQAERYRFFVTDAPIEEVAHFYSERAPAGSERPFVVGPGAPDAFDHLARFDRFALARLYGGRRPQVARGPLSTGLDRQVSAVGLLMSPYPEADLGRLNPGTLIMVVYVGKPPKPDRARP